MSVSGGDDAEGIVGSFCGERLVGGFVHEEHVWLELLEQLVWDLRLPLCDGSVFRTKGPASTVAWSV